MFLFVFIWHEFSSGILRNRCTFTKDIIYRKLLYKASGRSLQIPGIYGPNPNWFNHPGLLPRTYPPHFGLRMVKLFPHLLRSRSMPPQIPGEMAALSAQEFFDNLTWDDKWEDALMFDVLAYIRGNTALELGEWRSSFPDHLWSISCSRSEPCCPNNMREPNSKFKGLL